MTFVPMGINAQVRCTCMFDQCRQRGCHVLTGPHRLGYQPWIPGVTICADCPAVHEEAVRR